MYPEMSVLLVNGAIIIEMFFLLKILVKHQLYLDDHC